MPQKVGLDVPIAPQKIAQLSQFLTTSLCLLALQIPSSAEIKVLINHNPNDSASSAFNFKQIPSPSKTDAATHAKFTIIHGERDDNGGDLTKLNDGKLPTEEDQPSENFFFNAGTEGGRLLLDLQKEVEIKQINTYSWHPNTRGPQVYQLYASDGKAADFNAAPKGKTDPLKSGWKLLAKVDTRPKDGESGGQYGVSISDSEGNLGTFRYLLFAISRTESDDDFGNTFYSEIDVISSKDSSEASATETPAVPPYVTHSADGKCEISIDTSQAPELKDWSEQKLAPVLAEWYPKIAVMLASENFTPPRSFSVTVKPSRGVAATSNTRVTANSGWLKNELDREAIGALLHEEVHVIQQYWRRRDDPDAPRTRAPGWLVEGIPDYIRWFKYEPQSHGADITWLRGRKNISLRYDARYRVSANFLDYVVEKYDKELIKKLNAACREDKYSDDLWKTYTGKSVEELNDEWKTFVQSRITNEAAATP